MAKLMSYEEAAGIAPKSNLMSYEEAAGLPAEEPQGGFMPAAKQAIGAGIKGLGQAAADFIPGVEKGNALSSYGQSVIDANPTAIRSLGDIADRPLKAITEATGNAGGSMASMLGARGVGMAMTAAAPFTGPAAPVVAGAGQLIANVGPFVAAALPSYGGIRGDQIAADPMNEQDARSKAIALLGAGTVGAIEGRFGPEAWALAAMKKGGIEAVAKNFATAKSLPGFIGKGALKGAAVEGSEELVQNPIEQLASYQDPTTGKSISDTALSGAMGAIGGGVLSGGMAGVSYNSREQQPTPKPVAPPSGPMGKAAATAQQSGAADAAAMQQAMQDQAAFDEQQAKQAKQKGATNEQKAAQGPIAEAGQSISGAPISLAGAGTGTGTVKSVPQSSEMAVDAGGSEGGNAARSATDVAPNQTIAQPTIVQPQDDTQSAAPIQQGEITPDGTQTQEAEQTTQGRPAQPATAANAAGLAFTTPPQPTTNAGPLPQQSVAMPLPTNKQSLSVAPTTEHISPVKAPYVPQFGGVIDEGVPTNKDSLSVAPTTDSGVAVNANFVSTRTDKQLAYLSTNGQPGYKEAAIAEIARRAGGNVSTTTPATAGEFRAEALSRTTPQQEAQEVRSPPEVAQPTKMQRISFDAITIDGPKKVSGHLLELPGYKGPQLAVVEYKIRGNTGYRVYLPKSGVMVEDSNGVATMNDTLKVAVHRVSKLKNSVASDPNQTVKEESAPGVATNGLESAKGRDSESNQDRSWREYEENYAEVTGDIQAATDKNILRAIGFASKAIGAYQKRAFAGDDRAKSMIDSLNREIVGLEQELARRKPSVANPVNAKSAKDNVAEPKGKETPATLPKPTLAERKAAALERKKAKEAATKAAEARTIAARAPEVASLADRLKAAAATAVGSRKAALEARLERLNDARTKAIADNAAKPEAATDDVAEQLKRFESGHFGVPRASTNLAGGKFAKDATERMNKRYWEAYNEAAKQFLEGDLTAKVPGARAETLRNHELRNVKPKQIAKNVGVAKTLAAKLKALAPVTGDKKGVRTYLQGVHVEDSGRLVATNGNQMAVVDGVSLDGLPAKPEDDKQFHYTVLGNDGKWIDGKFPDYARVMPTKHATVPETVSVTDLGNYARGVRKAADYSHSKVAPMPIHIGNGKGFFDAPLIEKVANAFRAFGHGEALVSMAPFPSQQAPMLYAVSKDGTMRQVVMGMNGDVDADQIFAPFVVGAKVGELPVAPEKRDAPQDVQLSPAESNSPSDEASKPAAAAAKIDKTELVRRLVVYEKTFSDLADGKYANISDPESHAHKDALFLSGLTGSGLLRARVAAGKFATEKPGIVAEMNDKTKPTEASKPTTEEDLRGFAYAIVKDGRILTSGSFPAKEYMPDPAGSELSTFKKLAEDSGADLYVGGYANSSVAPPDDSLILGMTWDELSARQMRQSRPAPKFEGKIPSDAVMVYEHGKANKPAVEVGKPASEGGKPAGEGGKPGGIYGYSSQPESFQWAAKEVGGAVVYSRGDIALVEGFSPLGNAVYAGVKGDSRTRADISAYTGKMFSETEKAELEKAKADHVKEQGRLHEKAPEGPFSNGARFAKADGVSDELAGVAQKWLSMLGIKSRVFVATKADVSSVAAIDKYNLRGPFSAIRSAGTQNEADGGKRTLPNGDHYIILPKSARKSQALEALAHEIGHILETDEWAGADKATKDAVIADYQKWLYTAGNTSAADWVKQLRAHTSGKLTRVATSETADRLPPYWRSFSEYFADQVSRWATTSDKPLTAVDTFFKRIALAMRRLYAIAAGRPYLPGPAMKAYLDARGESSPLPISGKPEASEAAPAKAKAPEAGDKDYLRLLSLKSTRLLNESGGRKLYEVTLSPAFRRDNYDFDMMRISLPVSSSFELKEKSSITGNPLDDGYILIDKREQTENRAPAKAPEAKGGEAETATMPAQKGVGNQSAQATITPSDSAIYDMAREGKSAQEILAFIGSSARRPFDRYLAKALMNLGVKSTIKLDMFSGWKISHALPGKRYAAAYSPKTDTVAIFTPRGATQSVLHELVHAATLKALTNPRSRAAIEMRRLFKHVQDSGLAEGMYGTRNLEEFVAEAFSNPKFQHALMSIPAPSGSSLKSAWEWFVGVVARMLGMRRTAQATALDRAMVLGAAVMNENAAIAGNATGGNRYAIAHHGTPHVFAPEPGFPHGRFRLDKMGTGEGAQAYGWGVYFAENKDVAGAYQKQNTFRAFDLSAESAKLGFALNAGARGEVVRQASTDKSNDLAAVAVQRANIAARDVDSAKLANLIAGYRTAKEGAIYQLDIPDDVMPKLLDWDKPLSEQPKAVRNALSGKSIKNRSGQDLLAMNPTGKEIVAALGKEDGASEYLASIGIPGLRYLDGDSRNRPLKEIKREFLNELPEDAEFSEVEDLIGTGKFSPKNDALLKALKADDWLGFDYPAQAISAALGAHLGNFDASKELLQAVESAKEGGTHNYVIWDQKTLDRIALLERNGEALDDIRFREADAENVSVNVGGDIPDTITIDGVERPRMNSNGKPIAQTDEALRKFYAWFGDSAVTDEKGRPLVMYHGTHGFDIKSFAPQGQESEKALSNWREAKSNNKPFGYMNFRSGTFFSPNQKYAESYASEQSGIMYPVYIKAEFPVRFDQINGRAIRGETQKTPDALFMVDGNSINEVAILDPAQVKSATGNAGEFSPDNPDIRFREQDSPGQWQSTEPGLLDDVIYKLQHKQIDTRRTVQAVTKAIGDIADKYNPELKESLYHGRAANETRKFLDFELRPLTRRMIALGVDTPTLEAFLWARHAEERNAHIAKINPRMPDGGSGLTNAQAKQLLAGNDVTINGETIAGVPQNKLDELGELSAMADAMLDKSRELLVENGLETRATIDAWKSDYPHYVPLHREEFEDDRMTGRGLGMSVKGPSGKRAIGSDKPVGNILAAIVSQRELYITRAEKNRVGNALYGLATTAPNEEFWKAVDPAANANRDAEALWAQIKQRMTKLASMPNGDPDLEAIIDGMKAQHKAMMKKAIPGMKKVVDSLVSLGLPAEMAERVLAEPKELAINPRTGMVVERVNPLLRHLDNVVATRINGRDVFVVFDARDKRASRMAIAMKNLDADQLGFLLGNMAKATRYFSAINTQFNPIFGVTNFVRDIQTAMLNLSSTPLADHKKEVATRSLSAMRGIYSDLRAQRAGNLPSSKWAAMFERFKQAGGATGYRDMFETLSDRSKALQDELKKMSMSKGRRLFTLGQSNPVFAWLSDYNEMMENSVRVAAFSVGIEKGLSDDQAASLAKELTVNFNKKGQVAAQAGAMYAFFNAAVQGSARIAQTLFVNHDGKVSLSSVGKKIVSGGIMIGVAQAFLGALAGWDDEEPPQFVRERSLIIPLGDHYFSVPMPLGFNVLPNIGRITAEFAISGFKDPAKRIGSLLNVLADTLNPIGNAGVSLQTIAPTVIDPLAALAENKDWTGKPIKRMSFNEEAAGYKNAKDTATVWSKWIAEGLNYLSGGTEHKAGLSSPTPDQIDYLIGQVTGGVGREISKAVQSSTSVFSGEDLPLYKVPLVGKFVGDTNGNAADASRFYANVRELKAHKAELDGRRKAGQDVAEYLRDNPDARLVVLASRIERRVQELRRSKRELVDQGAPKDRVKQAEDQIAALMKALNNRVQANQRAA